MSRKRKYKIWIEPHTDPVNPRIAELLAPVILDFAILDDVTCPSVGAVSAEDYVNDLAGRLRNPICQVVNKAGIQPGDEELLKICRGTASEVLVIRGLCEALQEEEIGIEDIRHLPFFKTYRDYFEQTPEIVYRAFQMAISAAACQGPPETNSN